MEAAAADEHDGEHDGETDEPGEPGEPDESDEIDVEPREDIRMIPGYPFDMYCRDDPLYDNNDLIELYIHVPHRRRTICRFWVPRRCKIASIVHLVADKWISDWQDYTELPIWIFFRNRCLMVQRTMPTPLHSSTGVSIHRNPAPTHCSHLSGPQDGCKYLVAADPARCL